MSEGFRDKDFKKSSSSLLRCLSKFGCCKLSFESFLKETFTGSIFCCLLKFGFCKLSSESFLKETFTGSLENGFFLEVLPND